ncbi:MAG: hypothetical protein Q4D62_15210 [Planctomycetia bacterium]|nr:hypothetical protein [Planctomycetia bacterium]
MLEPLLAERFVSSDEDAALSLNLCLKTGYVGKENLVEAAGYVPNIRPRGAEKCELEHNPNFGPVTGLSKRLTPDSNPSANSPPRYEKTDKSYYPLLHLAAEMMALNKVVVIYG